VRVRRFSMAAAFVVLASCSGVAATPTTRESVTTSVLVTTTEAAATTGAVTTTMAVTTTTQPPVYEATFAWGEHDPAPLGLLGERLNSPGLSWFYLAGRLVSVENLEHTFPGGGGTFVIWVATFDFGPHPVLETPVLGRFFIGEAGESPTEGLVARLCPMGHRLSNDPVQPASRSGIGCLNGTPDDFVDTVLKRGVVYAFDLLEVTDVDLCIGSGGCVGDRPPEGEQSYLQVLLGNLSGGGDTDLPLDEFGFAQTLLFPSDLQFAWWEPGINVIVEADCLPCDELLTALRESAPNAMPVVAIDRGAEGPRHIGISLLGVPAVVVANEFGVSRSLRSGVGVQSEVADIVTTACRVLAVCT